MELYIYESNVSSSTLRKGKRSSFELRSFWSSFQAGFFFYFMVWERERRELSRREEKDKKSDIRIFIEWLEGSLDQSCHLETTPPLPLMPFSLDHPCRALPPTFYKANPLSAYLNKRSDTYACPTLRSITASSPASIAGPSTDSPHTARTKHG